MTYGMNQYSDISSFVNTVFEDALFVARENTLAVNLVRVFNDRTGMALRKNQEYGTADIYAIGEADDLTSQVFNPTALSTLTPAEYGGQFLITDQRLETDPFGAREDASFELGARMAEKIDTDVFANFSSLTGGTIDAAGTVCSWGFFYAMMARLRAQKVPLAGAAFVCHPYHWHAMGTALIPSKTVTNAPALQDAITQNFWVGRVSGVDIYTSMNVPTSGTDAYAALFLPVAIAYDVRRAPRLEPERDASRRAWELNMTAIYADGVWRPKFGIQGLFDATAPTGL